MSGIDEPGTPPEVPEEYADVYRDAYQRALAEEPETGLAAELLGGGVVLTREPREPRERPGWLVPAAAGGALVLVACAFVLGKMLSSDNVAATDAPVTTATTAPTTAAPSATPTKSPSAKPTKKAVKAWAGPVVGVLIDGVTATCTASPGNDSAGNPVRYDADNAIDSDPTTAWRCDGTGIGTVLTLTLPVDTPVGQVGLIPGYAKTDPKSGADRYAENNRITKVRWTLVDGTTVVQTLDPDPEKRDPQLLRVPRTATGSITLEILAVDRGRRNTTAISELAVYQAR